MVWLWIMLMFNVVAIVKKPLPISLIDRRRL